MDLLFLIVIYYICKSIFLYFTIRELVFSTKTLPSKFTEFFLTFRMLNSIYYYYPSTSVTNSNPTFFILDVFIRNPSGYVIYISHKVSSFKKLKYIVWISKYIINILRFS